MSLPLISFVFDIVFKFTSDVTLNGGYPQPPQNVEGSLLEVPSAFMHMGGFLFHVEQGGDGFTPGRVYMGVFI